MRRHHLLLMLVVLLAVAAVHARQPDAAQIAQERRQAELDAPRLVEVLELKPGMTVADVASGFGAMTVVLGHWIGSGRVFATDINEPALRETRESATSITTSRQSTRSTGAWWHRSSLVDAWPSSTPRIAAEVRFPKGCPPIAVDMASHRASWLRNSGLRA
jgi:predicted methyltransferase